METRYELTAYKDNSVLWIIGFHNSDDAISFARNRVKDRRRESFHTLVLRDEGEDFMSWTRRPQWTVEKLMDGGSTRLI